MGTKTGRLIVASNRGAYKIHETPQGIETVPAISGLVSAVEPLLKELKGLWIAWGGREAAPGGSPPLRLRVPADDPCYTFIEVPLTAEEIERYYYGFANNALWPLCHYFLEKCHYRLEDWNAYVQVNHKFSHIILNEAQPGDLLWINDYHLALLPSLIRYSKPRLKQFFFWHIPFPHPDLFGTLPWAPHILRGLLGADVLGFHLNSYVDNFLHGVAALVGAPVDFKRKIVYWQKRRIQLGAWPMGIDFEEFQSLARDPGVKKLASQLRKDIGTEKILLSVERLDYTKGVMEKLLAWEKLLEEKPEWVGRASLLQIAVPSRTCCPAYRELKKGVEAAVGRINGRFSEGTYRPVHYFWKGLPRAELVSYYMAADVMLVTPLRDGLNLVAKEYVASRLDGTGVLVLSRFAGAAQDLKDALLVNPYDLAAMVRTMDMALRLSLEEQEERMALLQEKVRRYDSRWWLSRFQQAVMSLEEDASEDFSETASS
ncbi:MAG TPA: trehalose-6-phosphate synthase [Moorella mulderi]|nr:trehalose-6-phosphate synthase [Moorella mulderi]